jgi:hypothetical protein
LGGEALGHQGGHGPQESGLVAFWQVFVVAGAAAVRGDPGQVRSTTHRLGGFSKACASRLRTISGLIFKLAAQVASLPEHPTPARTRRMRVQQRDRFHSSGRAASGCWTEAAVITTASSSPVVSTADRHAASSRRDLRPHGLPNRHLDGHITMSFFSPHAYRFRGSAWISPEMS